MMHQSDHVSLGDDCAQSTEGAIKFGRRQLAIMSQFWIPLVIGAVLIGSGIYHLVLLWATDSSWEGPLSLRKPGLFGVSAGITVWSIVWVLTRLKTRRHDEMFAALMAVGLLIEVGLITIQQWRGVPSHFNHSTLLDETIERIMLGLILLVTVGVFWLCVRSNQNRPMSDSRSLALRAGLWFLLVSCGLGLVATIVGEMNLAAGRSPEVWGNAGVLKYPHGAALHAIQWLPLMSFVLDRLSTKNAKEWLLFAIVFQALFLTHALWQTLCGRSRTDVDWNGIVVLAVVGFFVMKSVRSNNHHRHLL